MEKVVYTLDIGMGFEMLWSCEYHDLGWVELPTQEEGGWAGGSDFMGLNSAFFVALP